MTTAHTLDPATLRFVAEDLDDRAAHLTRCCGGQHTSHGARIAAYAALAADYRNQAVRAETEADRG